MRLFGTHAFDQQADAFFQKMVILILTSKSMNGLRYAPTLSRQPTAKMLVYQCLHCRAQYHRKRRINTERYCCRRCQGKLIFIRQLQS